MQSIEIHLHDMAVAAFIFHVPPPHRDRFTPSFSKKKKKILDGFTVTEE